jgi:hypothetical protein
MKDPVPIVPGTVYPSFRMIQHSPAPIGRFLGYAHPEGEVHISEDSSWLNCPGHDNTSTDCIVGDVPNIFESVPGDHSGPYNGVTMGC